MSRQRRRLHHGGRDGRRLLGERRNGCGLGAGGRDGSCLRRARCVGRNGCGATFLPFRRNRSGPRTGRRRNFRSAQPDAGRCLQRDAHRFLFQGDRRCLGRRCDGSIVRVLVAHERKLKFRSLPDYSAVLGSPVNGRFETNGGAAALFSRNFSYRPILIR